jgi:hypothetical protein
MTIVLQRHTAHGSRARSQRHRRRTGPLAQFRLYPEARRGLYITVMVWPSLRALRRATRRLGDSQWRTTAGYCYSYDRFRIRPRRKPRRLLDFATVHLARERLTMRVVSHELMHATLAWARRVGFNLAGLAGLPDDAHASDDEERICTVHGELCREFMVKANRAGLYR